MLCSKLAGNFHYLSGSLPSDVYVLCSVLLPSSLVVPLLLEELQVSFATGVGLFIFLGSRLCLPLCLELGYTGREAREVVLSVMT